MDKQLVANLRTHHFTIDETKRTPETVRDQYTSLASANFDYKGNPLHLKSSMDVALKKDLTTNHFEIGGSARVSVSNMTRSFKQLTTQEVLKSRQALDTNRLQDLRKSHFMLGATNTGGKGRFLDRVGR